MPHLRDAFLQVRAASRVGLVMIRARLPMGSDLEIWSYLS